MKSIPLLNITDCGFDESGAGRFNTMSGDLPSIYVDTASSGDDHEVTGLALKNSKAFVDAILTQRDKVSGGVSAMTGTTNSPPDKSTDTSITDRLNSLKELHEKGVLTAKEYEVQRQKNISSI